MKPYGAGVEVATTIRAASPDDQPFISEMQYLALFVPPGDPPWPPGVLDDPAIARYHVGFGTRPGDVGVIAEPNDRRPLGALLERVPRLSLSVDARNPAMRLYERLGFGVVRRDDHHVVMLRR